MVVAELAHYASLPPNEVERMLDAGEVPVLSNLDRAEAERAAYELNELGAVVDLRLTDATSGVFPVLKPDADRQVGVAVGGLIDDSATPPTVGESFGGLPQVEPDPEIPQAPRSRPAPGRHDGLSVTLGSEVHRMPTGNHRPAVTRGQGPDPLEASPYVEPAPRHELLTDHGPPGLGEEPIPAPRPGERRPGEYGLHNPDPRAARGAPRSPGASAPGGRRAPATKTKPKPKRKKSQPNMDGLLGELGPSAPLDTPKLPKRLERATAAAERSSDAIEIDFAAVGIDRPSPHLSGAQPQGSLDLDFGTMGSAPSSALSPARNAGSMPRRTRAGNVGGTGATAAGYTSPQTGGVVEALRNDGVAGLILGLGVGLILSMVLALQLQRGEVRDAIPPLEEELAASLRDPAGVEAGELRAAGAVEEEISQTLDQTERKFLLWWLGVGLPVGFVLSRLRSL